MNFASDNVAPAPREIIDTLIHFNQGPAKPYGQDEATELARAKFRDLFERDELEIFPVATGTGANALALSCMAPPFGAIYCHESAHIQDDECGAPEFFTGGAKLIGLPGDHGKITAETLTAALEKGGAGVVHHVQPAAVSLSQATEAGTVYRPEEIAAIAAVAHRHGLGVHMDGARFANAVATLGCPPADLTWRAGVDVLSFGATKNGAMAAECVLFFTPALAAQAGYRRKRAGHLLSKLRFLSAQLLASIEKGRWLAWAHHANTMATAIADGLSTIPGAVLRHPVEANEVFIDLPEPVIEGLLAEGFWFYRWGNPTTQTVRLIAAWCTSPAEVAHLVARARHHAEQMAA